MQVGRDVQNYPAGVAARRQCGTLEVSKFEKVVAGIADGVVRLPLQTAAL
jgi:hypothetical protein